MTHWCTQTFCIVQAFRPNRNGDLEEWISYFLKLDKSKNDTLAFLCKHLICKFSETMMPLVYVLAIVIHNYITWQQQQWSKCVLIFITLLKSIRHVLLVLFVFSTFVFLTCSKSFIFHFCLSLTVIQRHLLVWNVNYVFFLNII